MGNLWPLWCWTSISPSQHDRWARIWKLLSSNTPDLDAEFGISAITMTPLPWTPFCVPLKAWGNLIAGNNQETPTKEEYEIQSKSLLKLEER